MLEAGASWREVGEPLGIPIGTVRRICDEREANAVGFVPVEITPKLGRGGLGVVELAGRRVEASIWKRRWRCWLGSRDHTAALPDRRPRSDGYLSRVPERVRQGGYDVPEDVVRRRFVSGRENFETLYKPIVDKWLLY